MKKLFFFRSSASTNGNNNPGPSPSKDKQVYWENLSDGRINCQATDKRRTEKQAHEEQSFATSPCLRRSTSYSSATVRDSGLGRRNLSNDRSGSPCSSRSNISLKQFDPHSSRCRAVTPERQSKARWFQAAAAQNALRIEKPACVASRAHCDSSESSSNCSSNLSNSVVDRYVDVEHQQEQSTPKSNSSFRNIFGHGGGNRPSRVQYTAPASPTDGMKKKPRSHSCRESKGSQPYFSSRDWMENGFGHESPRNLAKHVIERLSQSRVLPRVPSKEFDPDVPITIEDIYGGSLNRCPSLDGVSRRNSPVHRPDEPTSGDEHTEISGFPERNCGDNSRVLNSVEAQEDIDVELHRKSEEAEDRAMFLSEGLDQESFLDRGFSVPALIQTVRDLTEERVNMALEVSAVMEDRIAERASAREELRLAREELDSQTRKLEREKNELESALEKELDRRSNEWSFKLEKYQAEEHRLRERVRELAEQNVALQREVSSFSQREMDSRSRITYSELQLKDLSTRVEEATEDNQNLQHNLSELKEKYKAVEEDRDCFRRNYQEKEKECKELHRSVTRLLRTCSEQEKTINGLRGLNEEVMKKNLQENFDKRVEKLQREQIRLVGVEQALRKEVDSCKLEIDSLRHENINLLHRLKGSGKEGVSAFKLDQEIWNRVHCLQNQGPSLLNESIQLNKQLLEYIKTKAGHSLETKLGNEVIKNGLEGQFVIESDVKLQGVKRGAENLTRSLQTVSATLHKKSQLGTSESPSASLCDGLGQINEQSSEDVIRSELKAETLLTNLLREKLYFKELDLEQLQAELATAVRGNDILRCEVQNAMDTLSCVTHEMKELELQVIKKDENINRLQNDLQECSKKLTIVRGILPQVSEERDMMWQEVKQYSEQTMLLNSEVSGLKKKIETLDEDILLKEGQITILKESLGKPFDLLGSPDCAREFLFR